MLAHEAPRAPADPMAESCVLPPPAAEASATAALVRFLADPASHRPRPAQVQSIETHISWVFLVDDLAYKLKKPVAQAFLDFRTLAAREADCRDEVRLNRRLAPGIYLGLTRIVRAADGTLALADENGAAAPAGETVDWLVRMRRLPAARTLDALIGAGTLTAAHVTALGALLGSFYGHLPPADLDAAGYVALLRSQHALNVDVLRRAPPGVGDHAVRRVLDAVERFLDRESARLAERIAAGRVVEGHGDLRPEHVFLLESPVVIDCLEFSRSLRLVDWADEIALLDVECARLGAVRVGPALRAAVGAALDDAVDDRLFAFYAALRASLRARLALAHLDEPHPRTPRRWPQLAADYLALALPRAQQLAAAGR
jgi:aminoglycoside phosphotransferase family enzyme